VREGRELSRPSLILACHLIENSVNYTYRGFTNNSIRLSLITGIANSKHYHLSISLPEKPGSFPAFTEALDGCRRFIHPTIGIAQHHLAR
jgi:hypothetical protein